MSPLARSNPVRVQLDFGEPLAQPWHSQRVAAPSLYLEPVPWKQPGSGGLRRRVACRPWAIWFDG